MIFVDTNYFLRLLLKDIDFQYKAAKRLFERAVGGKITLFTSLIVMFEVYWVLASFYKKDKKQAVRIMEDMFSLNCFELRESDLLRKSMELCIKTSLGLEDSYNLVYAINKKAEDFKTFDKKLEKAFRAQ